MRLCGIVSDIRKRLDKRENTIAFVRVEQYVGSCECVFWSDKYREYESLLQTDAVLVFVGRCEVNGQNVKIYVDRVLTLEQAEKELSKGYVIRLDPEAIKDETLEELRGRCDTAESTGSLTFIVSRPDGRVQYLTSTKVPESREMTDYLCATFGESNILLDVEG